ncbi:GATA transcription factor 22 [Canna indica]|uniref:GATA transcription factor 22 n=1 Tax=Canna indica TaxID=4628 RepID=A0AAQ3JZL1_9LILI|nr:GATA transcription factor 22 [Canna indica]
MAPAYTNQLHLPQEGEQAQAFLFQYGPYPLIFNSSLDQRGCDDQFHEQQLVPLDLFLQSGSSDTVSTIGNKSSKIIGQSSSHLQHHREDVHGSVKCTYSKTIASDEVESGKRKAAASRDQERRQRDMNGCSGSGSARGGAVSSIKMCSVCNTTKTPLWRSGPKGPKSLCNACGIRQRKARRAMEAAAAAAGSGLIIPADRPGKVRKEKKTDRNCMLPYKKRYKIVTDAAAAAQKRLPVDDMIVSLSKKSALYQVFPQDEKDAAILLMSLSCGLVHG